MMLLMNRREKRFQCLLSVFAPSILKQSHTKEQWTKADIIGYMNNDEAQKKLKQNNAKLEIAD